MSKESPGWINLSERLFQEKNSFLILLGSDGKMMCSRPMSDQAIVMQIYETLFWVVFSPRFSGLHLLCIKPLGRSKLFESCLLMQFHLMCPSVWDGLNEVSQTNNCFQIIIMFIQTRVTLFTAAEAAVVCAKRESISHGAPRWRRQFKKGLSIIASCYPLFFWSPESLTPYVTRTI